ncbi:hypothetical protein FS749_007850 [Ceratobasidium sp. UAMH 11750]|nr:hypothetical protein FS749_007850 [Ceratobasidium sp. UAMH 11750]
MVDSIKREDDLPVQDSINDTGTILVKDLGALSLKQDPIEDPVKEVKEAPSIAPRSTIYRRGKSKGDALTLEQFAELLLPSNKFFLAKHDDGRPEIYCWTTPRVDLGHLYRVDPINGAFTNRTDAFQAFTIGSSTYEPNIQDQTLYMRIPSGYQPVHLFYDFHYAQASYFELTRQTATMPPNTLGRNSINIGTGPSHPAHDASSPPETSTAGTNVSASGTSSACGKSGIPESDLASTPMILRVPGNVNPEDPNASDCLHDHAKMFKEEYDKRGDKTLKVSCFHCSKLQKVLRPSSLARHLRLHCGVKDFACDRCVKKCNTQQQLDRHKTNHHGVPAPKPKLVKGKLIKAKAAKLKAAKR